MFLESARRNGSARRLLKTALIALLLCAAYSLGPQFQAVELFGPSGISLRGPQWPSDLAVADFDGDGVNDIAVIGGEDQHLLNIYGGDGQGAFTRRSEIELPTYADWYNRLEAVDFNGDGAMDLIVTTIDGTVHFLYGDGSGDFSIIDLSDGNISPIVSADFDLDGHVDLAYAGVFDRTVRILLGDGSGGYQRQWVSLSFDYSPALEVGDFNGDGLPDLAAAGLDWGTSMVEVLHGDGAGGFQPARWYPTGDYPLYLTAGDFNADGTDDLAVANYLGESLTILLSSTPGELMPSAELALGRGPITSPDSADLNGDGFPDLVVLAEHAHSAIVLTSDGEGGFAQTGEFSVGWWPEALALKDLNADGSPDLVNGNDDSVRVLLGDGAGGFVNRSGFEVGERPLFIASGDLNGDGADDLVTSSTQDDVIMVMLSDGGGSFQITDVDADTFPIDIAIADLVGRDDHLDVAVACWRADEFRLYEGDGSGVLTPVGDYPVGDGPRGIVAADLDLNGDMDLAVSNIADSSVSVLHGDGSPEAFGSGSVDIPVGSGPVAIDAGDLNNDGFPDLVTANQSDFSATVLFSDGAGSYSRTDLQDVAFRPWGIKICDTDADGNNDVLVIDAAGEAVTVIPGDGAGGFGPWSHVNAGTDTRDLTCDDFNRDGVLDLAVVNAGNNSTSVLLGDGTGGFLHLPDLTIGLGPEGVASGDFDGDGDPDIAAVTFEGGEASILFNQFEERTDLNGSNRTDGFDLVEVGLAAGTVLADPEYLRRTDVDLNGVVDGDDLSAVASRFGELNRKISPFRPALVDPLPLTSDTVTFQPVATEGDRLTVQVSVDDDDDPVAGADFGITFGPNDGVSTQVLQFVRFEPGDYLSGGVGQAFHVEESAPDRIDVSAARLPNINKRGSGAQSLLNLIFKARREGTARLEFVNNQYPDPSLLDSQSHVAPGVEFTGDVGVSVTQASATTRSSRPGVAPAHLDFGDVAVDGTARKKLRVSNLGFSDLVVSNVESTLPEFASFLTSPVTIPPFGHVELQIEFSPSAPGLYSAELVVVSESSQPEVRVPVAGRAGLALSVAPVRLDFEGAPVGQTRSRWVRLTNHGADSLVLTGYSSTDRRFVAEVDFVVLAPNESASLAVHFSPDGIGIFRGSVILDFDAPASKVVILSAEGWGEADEDIDGVADRIDNCPLIGNSAQSDTDGDGVGDLCDLCELDVENDIDIDGICSGSDNCPLQANVGQYDLDSDSFGDVCDSCPTLHNPFQGSPAKINDPILELWSVDSESSLISPDGTTVVYIIRDPASSYSQLLASPISGGGTTELCVRYRFFVNSAQISPDGSMVVFQVWDFYNQDYALFSVPITGGQTTRITPWGMGWGTYWDYWITPDSTTVVYQWAYGDFPIDLYRVGIHGGSRTKLNHTLPQDGYVGALWITQDGSSVVYHAKEGNQTLYIVPIDGGTPAKLTPHATPPWGALNNFDVSLDGSVVAYRWRQEEGAPLDLHIVPTAGGEPIRLNPDLVANGFVHDQIISLDSSTVVYLAEQEQVGVIDLYSVPVSGGEVTKLSPPTILGGGVTAGTLSVVGTLAFISAVDFPEFYELYSVPVTGGTVTKLSGELDPDSDVTSVGMTADGSTVAYVADRDMSNVFELFSVPSVGGASTRLSGRLTPGGDVGGDSFDSAPRISPDGSTVVYVADQDSNWLKEIYSTELSSDGDADGAPLICDNCPEDPNPDQSDLDSDGIGDVCDSVRGIAQQDSHRPKTKPASPRQTRPDSSRLKKWTDDTDRPPRRPCDGPCR